MSCTNEGLLESMQAYERDHVLCEVFCPEKPELLRGAPIGQYHCPNCGVMVLAGLPHPKVVRLDDGTIDYSWL